MAKVLGGEHASDILAYFASTNLTPYEALTELITTAIWLEPALATFQRFARLGRTSYVYRFARVSPGARRSGLLAYHSVEIPYLFGTLTATENYDEIDTRVSNVVQHAWTEFARTGIPQSLDCTSWPSVNESDPQFTLIADLAQGRPLDISSVTRMINSLREQQEIVLNVATLVDLTHSFLPAMLARRQGAIINVASLAAFQPIPYMAVYAATKAFVLSFSEALWGEYRAKGVRVLALSPGETSTQFFQDLGGGYDAPLGNVETPEQVVQVGLRALEQGRPSVISGKQNALTANFSRFFPRGLVVRLTMQFVKLRQRTAPRAKAA